LRPPSEIRLKKWKTIMPIWCLFEEKVKSALFTLMWPIPFIIILFAAALFGILCGAARELT